MNHKVKMEVEDHLYETRKLLQYLAYKTEKKQPSSIKADVVEDLEDLVNVMESHDHIIKDYLYLLQKADCISHLKIEGTTVSLNLTKKGAYQALFYQESIPLYLDQRSYQDLSQFQHLRKQRD